MLSHFRLGLASQVFYYINTNEIPRELSRENISSHEKITCYFHTEIEPFDAFQHSKINFVSPSSYVVSSKYVMFALFCFVFLFLFLFFLFFFCTLIILDPQHERAAIIKAKANGFKIFLITRSIFETMLNDSMPKCSHYIFVLRPLTLWTGLFSVYCHCKNHTNDG